MAIPTSSAIGSADCSGWRRFDVSRGVFRAKAGKPKSAIYKNEKTQNDFGDRVIGDRCYAGSGAEQRTNAPGQVQVKAGDKQPIYKITTNVVDRTTKDKNHQHRNGATKIDLRGTPLMPAAHGEAKAESKQGYIESEVEFRNNESLHLQSRIRHGRQIS